MEATINQTTNKRGPKYILKNAFASAKKTTVATNKNRCAQTKGSDRNERKWKYNPILQ